MMKPRPLALLCIAISVAVLSSGCGDMGSDLPDTPIPAIAAVRPDSGIAGDSIYLSGKGFGVMRSSSVVRFGNIDARVYLRWSDTLIVTTVPDNSTTATITVIVGTNVSNPVGFKVSGSAATIRSFSRDVLPRLTQYGCVGCHGGGGGLYLDTQARLLQGGSHGPAIVPGDADASLLIQKMSANPPFGSRMPQGGPYLADSAMQVFREWIDQGAPDN